MTRNTEACMIIPGSPVEIISTNASDALEKVPFLNRLCQILLYLIRVLHTSFGTLKLEK